MLFQTKMQTEIKAADAVIARREKIRGAIAKDVEALGRLAQKLIDAEQAERDQEVRLALGDDAMEAKSPANPKSEKVRAEIAGYANRLQGLRSAFLGLAPRLNERRRAIAGELPEHNEKVDSDFSEEWTKAVAAFSRVVGKRAAIERSMGRKMNLREPVATIPQAHEIADALRPQTILDQIRDALESLISNPPDRYPDPDNGLRPFDPRKVYELTRDFQDTSGPGLQAGTLVVESMLDAGWLDFLAGVGNAVPFVDPGIGESRNAARMAVLQIQAEQRESRAEEPNPTGRVA